MTLSVTEQIDLRLKEALSPQFLEIINESYKHAGHNKAAAIPNAVTHFHIKIVSEKFKGLSRIQQHQLVFQILHDFIPDPIHALALTLSDK